MPSPTSTPWKSGVDVCEAALVCPSHLLVIIRHGEYPPEPLIAAHGALVCCKRVGSSRHARLALVQQDPHGLRRDNHVLGDVFDLMFGQDVPALARSLVVEFQFRVGKAEGLGYLRDGHRDNLQRVENPHRVPPREADIDAVVHALVRDQGGERARGGLVDRVDPCPAVVEQKVIQELPVELEVMKPYLAVLDGAKVVHERVDRGAVVKRWIPIDRIDITCRPCPHAAVIGIHRGLEIGSQPSHLPSFAPIRSAPSPNRLGYIRHVRPATGSCRTRNRSSTSRHVSRRPTRENRDRPRTMCVSAQ